MRYLLVLVVVALLLFISSANAQLPDPSDPALEAPPPPGGYKICPKPVLIEEPCEIYISGEQNGKPVITVAISMKKPVPVTYTIRTDDTAMYITLQVIRTKNFSRFQPRIQLPNDSFRVFVGYEDAPSERGIFLVSRADDGVWTIHAVEETGFIILGKPPEVVATQRKE